MNATSPSSYLHCNGNKMIMEVANVHFMSIKTFFMLLSIGVVAMEILLLRHIILC